MKREREEGCGGNDKIKQQQQVVFKNTLTFYFDDFELLIKHLIVFVFIFSVLFYFVFFC
jgi:hypothetical protein